MNGRSVKKYQLLSQVNSDKSTNSITASTDNQMPNKTTGVSSPSPTKVTTNTTNAPSKEAVYVLIRIMKERPLKWYDGCSKTPKIPLRRSV
jgi:hypothetical protein